MIWLVTVIDPNDPDYSCTFTVLADSDVDAKAFAELHNPGLHAVDAVQV